jgi:hypothetical protein
VHGPGGETRAEPRFTGAAVSGKRLNHNLTGKLAAKPHPRVLNLAHASRTGLETPDHGIFGEAHLAQTMAQLRLSFKPEDPDRYTRPYRVQVSHSLSLATDKGVSMGLLLNPSISLALGGVNDG